MKIFIANDHQGVQLKNFLIKHLPSNINVENLGCNEDLKVDYPDYAKELCQNILKNPGSFGILICGTGIGMSIAANRFRKIRAALCHDEFTAQAARLHNNANILVLGAKILSNSESLVVAQEFLKTPFDNSDEKNARHLNRINKLELPS